MAVDTTTELGGGLSSILIGALLPRLLNNDNNGFNHNRNEITAADITTQVGALLAIQDVNEVKKEVWQAEAAVNSNIAAASTANQVAILNAEISNLTGQASVTKAVTDSALADQISTLTGQANVTKAVTDSFASAQISNLQGQAALAGDISRIATETALGLGVLNTNVSNQAGILGVNVVNATAKTDNLVSVATNLINTNLLQGNYAIQSAITADGAKTRDLITSIQTADLNRQIVVAENKLAEAQGDSRAYRHSNEAAVTVTQNVNQAQAQAQQQQQLANLTGLVGQLVIHQNAVAQAINVGSGSQSANPVSTNIKS
jgi:hypothetical protein